MLLDSRRFFEHTAIKPIGQMKSGTNSLIYVQPSTASPVIFFPGFIVILTIAGWLGTRFVSGVAGK